MKNLRAFVLACSCLVYLGCGSSIPTHPVSGTVTDASGNPIEGAAVSFVPNSDEQKIAVGVTDAQGKYSLKTMGKDGAMAGAYKVAIAKYEGGSEESTTTAADSQSTNPDDPYNTLTEYPDNYDEQKEAEEAAKNVAANALPAKYADANTSGLTASVSEGENTFDFQLEKK